MFAIPCIIDGSHISVFSYTTSCICISDDLAHLSLQGYWKLDAGCLGLNLQTNRLVL